MVETERALYESRDDAALAVKKEKRDHANERRQRRRKCRDRAERAPTAEIESPEEKSEREANGQRGNHRTDRYDERAPERFAVSGADGERTPILQPVSEAADDDRDVRKDDAPGEERQHDQARDDESPSHPRTSAIGFGRSLTPTLLRSAKLPSSHSISKV